LEKIQDLRKEIDLLPDSKLVKIQFDRQQKNTGLDPNISRMEKFSERHSERGFRHKHRRREKIGLTFNTLTVVTMGLAATVINASGLSRQKLIVEYSRRPERII
jgi:hypothetical protein